jgi:hypothetical protein
MKRTILLFIGLLICIVSTAQTKIQTNFLGLRLCQTYSLSEAKEIISQKSTNSFINENLIYAFNVNFGGYDWIVRVSLTKELSEFGTIQFHKVHERKEEAESMCEALLDGLTKKYGKAYVSVPKYNDTQYYWNDGENSCLLELNQRYAKGKSAWCVELTYSNDKLRKQSIEENIDEL